MIGDFVGLLELLPVFLFGSGRSLGQVEFDSRLHLIARGWEVAAIGIEFDRSKQEHAQRHRDAEAYGKALSQGFVLRRERGAGLHCWMDFGYWHKRFILDFRPGLERMAKLRHHTHSPHVLEQRIHHRAGFCLAGLKNYA